MSKGRCLTCGGARPVLIVPAGWHHHWLAEERRSMWPDRCAACGRFVGLQGSPPHPIAEEIRRAGERLYARVMRHRERYLRAWIAATGLRPEECELVEVGPVVGPDNVAAVRVYVRKRVTP